MKNSLSQEMRSVASEIFRALGGPVADEALMYLNKSDWGSLVKMSVNPVVFDDPMSYFRAAQAVSLLKKMPGLSTGINTAEVAEEAFLRCERANHKTNLRLQELHFKMSYRLADDEDEWLGGFVTRWRRTVKKALGPLNPERILSLCEITSGTTFAHKGEIGALLPSKLSILPESTNRDLPLFTAVEQTYWYRSYHDMLFGQGPGPEVDIPLVRGNRFSTVPKDSTKDRGICIEPTLNLFFQKGLGNFLRARLQGIGLLLTPKNGHESSEMKHRRLACSGSRDGALATIDLSDASDLICYWLVKILLPEDWFTLFERGRSPATLFRGKWHRLEKFSSMGNGFTFELETLLFYSLVKTIMEARGMTVNGENLSVYGDDIICPSEVYADVVAALRYFGMVPNPKKSFSVGPFRESCGGDYFLGYEVRPISLKVDPSGPLDWIVVHNLVFRLGNYIPVDHILNLIKGKIPTEVRRCAGPPLLGDTVLHSNRPENYAIRRQHDIRWQRCIVPETGAIRISRFGWESAVGALILSNGSSQKGFPLRGDIRGWKLKWVPVS